MVGDDGVGTAEEEFAVAEELVCFGDEGGGDEAVVVQGLGAGGCGDACGGGDVPLEVGFEGTAGVEGVGAVVGLGEVVPGVVVFCFFLPVFESVCFDEGEEVDAELGFAAAGEFEGSDGRFSKSRREPVEEPFADAGGVADEVGDLPVLEVGEELAGEGWCAIGVLFEVLGALVGEDVDGRVDGTGLGVFG